MSVDRAEWAMQKPRLREWMAWRRYLIATRASSGATYRIIEEDAWIRLMDDLDRGVTSLPGSILDRRTVVDYLGQT